MITTEELLAEWDRIRAAHPNDEGYTTAEIQAALGWNRPRTLALLHALKHEGRLAMGTRLMERIDGRMTPIVVYRLIDG